MGEQNDLQFDRVEPAAGTTASTASECMVCKKPIAGYYFGLGQGMTCVPCHDQLLAGPQGSKFGRVMRAIAFGVGGGIAGALIWGVVSYLTGYSLGIIAIVVGFLVGAAVKAGARGVGGVGYQLIALAITYLAVGLAYTLAELPSVIQKQREHTAITTTTQPALATLASGAGIAGEEDDDEVPPLLFYVLLIPVFVVIGPVVVAIESPIAGIISAFALWEAWKMNKAQKLPFTGPFAVGAPAAPAGGVVPPPLPPLPPGAGGGAAQ